MAFDSILFTHFMTATRGHKTGKKDDGCGNWVSNPVGDFYKQLCYHFFPLSEAAFIIFVNGKT